MASEDEKLVKATLAGDKQAYGRLYDLYAQVVRAVCFDVTRSISDSEDLCHESFLQAYSNLHRLRRQDRFAAWLIQIARNISRRWQRNCQRLSSRTAAIDVDFARQGEQEQQPYSDGLAQLHQWLLQLPEKERLAVQSRYLLDESARQMGAILRLSRSGAYRVLERAMKRLRRLAKHDQREELP